MIYLDEAATAPVRREVLAAMGPYLGPAFGNPSSRHATGEIAARALDDARRSVADALAARPGEIVFCSGGTEAANLAVKGIAVATPRGRHVVVSSIEHPAVLESARWLGRLGFDVTELEVDADGLVHPETLAAALRDDTTLVSVQHANNEVGTVQPVAELASVCAERGVPFHTDAVQTAPWFDLDVGGLGVQALSLSGHKLGTPKGIGALWVRRGVPLEPVLHGGGQESGRRSGTENVAGAVGLAAALGLVDHAGAAEVAARRDAFIDDVLARVPGARLTGHRTDRLPGHASFVLPGRSGESVLLDLDRHGVASSSGSACHAGSDEPSHVLTAMGIEREVAQTAVRFSFGPAVCGDDLRAAAERLGAVAGATSGADDA